MSSVATISPDELTALREQLAQQQHLLVEKDATIALKDKQLEYHEDTIAWLQERLNFLLAKRYQHSSEKANALQGMLFDPDELDQAINDARQQLDHARNSSPSGNDNGTKDGNTRHKSSPSGSSNNAPHRKPLPEHLRRVPVDVDVSAEQKQAMGDEWEQIGWETSEQLACQECEYFVKQIRRAKYVRKTPDSDGLNTGGITVAPVLPVILPRAIADATLLAKIITGKYVDALSFNRECKVLAREGIEIGYSTLCSYPIQLADRLEPLKALFYEYAAAQPMWHLDETTLQVLQEPGREARQKSYLWAMRTGPADAPMVIFHYDERRNYDALSTWLEPALDGFNGVIITDEHKPYARLTDENPGIAARGGCWAHARRKLTDAIKGRRHESDPHRLVAEIAKLYKLEEKVKTEPFEDRLLAREKLIRPWLDSFKHEVDTLLPAYGKTGMMRTALYYIQNNWESLTAFMRYADLPLDNNPVESAIRPFALGRKNWLYTVSARGAHASAFMYSLVESAKANGLEPKAYLQALFERYPFANTVEQRRQLLPMYFKNNPDTG